MPIAIQKEYDRMQAIRQIQTVTENFVVVQLPESFRQRRIEVIVLPVDPVSIAFVITGVFAVDAALCVN